MKKITLIVLMILSFALQANSKSLVTESQCRGKGDSFIFAGGECIQFYEAKADRKDILNIIVHGTWKEGTNTLGRYSTFADDLAIQTEITTVAIALPGYSGSSTNTFEALSHEGVTNLASNKKYIEFLSNLVTSLQKKYNAKTVNYIGHSAGAAMGATLVGYTPKLITNLVCAGGSYDIHKKSPDKSLISAIDYVNQIDKKTNILLVYGTKDEISKPDVTKEFYKILKNKNFNVTIVEVKNAVHLDLDMTDTSVESIVNLLEEKG